MFVVYFISLMIHLKLTVHY